jgi:hypothetical protein
LRCGSVPMEFPRWNRGKSMSETSEIKRLAELFRKLGASDPEGWARSQVQEGIPQLARFLFLRSAWRCVVSEDDTAWIDQAIGRAEVQPDEPYAGVGHALKSLRVRGMQAQVLFHFCYVIADPGVVESEDVKINWALVELDDDGEPRGTIDSLHESVLETDPTGREMRPSSRAG